MLHHLISASLLITGTLAALCPQLSAADISADYVWVEGEDMVNGSLHDHHGNVSQHKNLSGGVSFGTNDLPQKGEWNVETPEAGTWHIYVRKFWKHGPFKWQVNGGTEHELTKAGTLLLDRVDLGVRHQGINWVYLGTEVFNKGKNTLNINGTSTKAGAFVIDCFAITKRPFEPSGLKKPGEKLGLAGVGKWAFEPDYDAYEKDALDLRSLNENIAGENGYVTVNTAGEFLDGNGKEIKFWCTQGNLQNQPGTDHLVRHAKHLAKRGINMYRHHGHLNPDAKDKATSTRKSQIDAIQKMVAVMKKEGIYSTVSPFWATHSIGGNNWVPGFKKGKLTGLVFWNDDFKKIYKKWWRDALLAPNPYDDNKLPLVNDPALAIIQLQNEDSLLFWTFQRFPKEQPELFKDLENTYFKWLKKKGYAKSALKIDFWQAINHPTDQHRHAMQFLTETMYEFNAEMNDFFRNELHCKALINAGNWKAADPAKLLDHERWSYTANEVIGVNRYVNGNGKAGETPHLSPTKTSGYQVNVGDSFQDVSSLHFPYKLPTNAKQVSGRTYIIPESTWVSPMSHQSEAPFLVAAYSALTGVDCYYWFALGSIGYDKSLVKWQAANPSIMGGWPAASLMFRKGYISQGKVAVHEERALKGDMWDLRAPTIVEEAGFDANRDESVTPLSAIKSSVPPLSYLVGPVEVTYDGDPSKSTMIDFSKFIKGNVINSNTGELSFDMDQGVCTLNAPCAQGASGFLKKYGNITTDALEIIANNDYATVLAVSMDGKDLKKSKKIFLQITTVCRPYGWKDVATDINGVSARKITNLGSSPWNVWNTDMSITINNKKLKKVTVLDANLYPTIIETNTKKSKKGLTITPANDTMYMIIE